MVRTSIKFEHFMSFKCGLQEYTQYKIFIYLFINNKIDKL